MFIVEPAFSVIGEIPTSPCALGTFVDRGTEGFPHLGGYQTGEILFSVFEYVRSTVHHSSALGYCGVPIALKCIPCILKLLIQLRFRVRTEEIDHLSGGRIDAPDTHRNHSCTVRSMFIDVG